MLVHSVYFWLKPGLGQKTLDAFRAGLLSLEGIPGVRGLHVGVPAPTPARPVLVSDYTFALTVLLDDMATHDLYQVSPQHKAFLETFSPCWTRVQVYDADCP